MAKLLKDIVKTKPTKVTNDLGGYSPKAGDEQQFAKKHSIDKYPDRNGNGDDVFNASKIKHSQIDEPRHGYKKPEDIKVHEAHSCNMTKEDVSCPVHGMKECSESNIKEDWIVTHSDGKVTKHLGQRDAMKASRSSPGSKVSATHGAMGQKASTVLAPHQRGNIGTFSAAGYTPPEKKKKMREEFDLEENKLYHVSWGGNREHQVVAKHGEEAVSKAKDAIIKKMPKLQDKKYADAFDRKPTVTNLSHERKVQKDKVQEEAEELDEISNKKKSDYNKAGKKWLDDFQKAPSFGVLPKDYDKQPKRVKYVNKTRNEEIEEGFVVRYNNPKSEKHGSEKHFDDQVAAKKHAARGNLIDKVGGKYTVHKTNEKGHDVKEEAELDEAMSLKQKAFSNRTKNHPGRKGGVFDTKSNFDAPDHKVHVVVSKGDKKETIKDVVQARDKNEAIFKTQMKYHKMGYKVHDTMHKGIVKEEIELDEVLSKSEPAGSWIKDFITSKNPKFAGKSKDKRKEMALAAYYAKQRNEEVEELDEVSKKTLGSYIKKAASDMARQREKRVDTSGTRTDQDKAHNKEFNRKFGIRTAVDKLTREEIGLDETYKKGDYVKHGKTGAVGQIQNISSDKSSVDVKWNKKGYITSHDSSDVKPMKEDLAIPLLGGGDGDESAEMLKTQLKAIANKAMHLVTQLSDDQLIEPWVQSKIAVAKEQVSAVHDYMIYGDHDTEKEQTGPDTPMTFPGMSVDVNTGRNV